MWHFGEELFGLVYFDAEVKGQVSLPGADAVDLDQIQGLAHWQALQVQLV